jgi:AraC-binding-like domain
MVMRELYSTHGMPAYEAVDHFRDALGRNPMPLDIAGKPPVDVRASLQAAEFTDIEVRGLNSVSDSAVALRRTRRLIRSSDPEGYRLVVMVAGNFSCEQGRQNVCMGPGDIALFHSSIPFDCSLGGGMRRCKMVTVTLPRSTIDIPERVLRPLICAKTRARSSLYTPTFRLLSQFGDGAPEVERLPEAEIAETIRGLVGGLLRQQLGLAVPGGLYRRSDVLLAKAAIMRRLHEPDLSPGTIADVMGRCAAYIAQAVSG